MFRRHVESVEVVEVVLDVRALGHGEAEVTEDLDDLFPDLVDGVDGALQFAAHRQRHVNRLAGETFVQRLVGQRCLAGGDRLRHLVLEQVEGRAEALALLGRHGAQALHLLGDRALLAQRCNAHRLKGRLVGSGVDLREGFALQGVQRHRSCPQNKTGP